MGSKLIFNKIKYENVFVEEFNNLSRNNVIEFNKNIAVLYGPNGTGKTSLSKVLKSENNSEDICYDIKFKGMESVKKEEIFHVISDQNNRNIIKGEAKDYLIGDNIEREELLLKKLEEQFENNCNSVRTSLKNIFCIKSKTHNLINEIKNSTVRNFVIEFANNRFKVENIDREKYINEIRNLSRINSEFKHDDEIYKYIIENSKDDNCIINKINKLDINDIKKNVSIKEIEEDQEAINILEKFSYKEQCIVCDNKDYNQDKLLKSKKEHKSKIEKSLDKKTKQILEGIIKLVKKQNSDPLEIENIFLEAIKTGELENVIKLQEKIQFCLENIGKEIHNLLVDNLDENLLSNYDEYKKIVSKQIGVDEEDILYLQNIISQSMGKEIDIARDKEKRIKITLGGNEFLGKDRNELKLSTGQQNFISLSFELLKAKKSKSKYIVLDDPISSFDSIYKNKIAFCIIKFLENRNRIILTHNTELIKLLEFQAQNSFELYLFNNTDGSENGFIKVNDEEKEILLKLNKLLDLFRNKIEDIDIKDYIENEDLFLISMIPFMRGYANILGKSKIYKEFCNVMHGYETEKINIGLKYKELFGLEIKDLEIGVDDILNFELNDDKILDASKYPLLNRTLYHTFVYLYLRLNVEKVLCSLDNNKVLEKINRNKLRQGDNYKGMTTQNIIDNIFNKNDKNKIKERVFFTSKKTLLNEFNHFEGNMNIFQPAIDITDDVLNKEKKEILKELQKLQNSMKVIVKYH